MEPSVSIRTVFWDDMISDAVRDEIVAATESILDAMGCDAPGGGILHPLRLIIITDYMCDADRHWRRELGHQEPLIDHTKDDVDRMLGKYITWGDGEPGRTFSVVLIHLYAGCGMTLVDSQDHNIMVHELAHVYLGAILRKRLGAVVYECQTDWVTYPLFVAINCFSEYYAEHVAVHYADDDYVEQSLNLLVMLASEGQARIRERVTFYLADGNTHTLWCGISDATSSFMAHMGRVLGLHHGRDLPADLITRLDALSPRFGPGLNELRVALEAVMAVTPDGIDEAAFAPVAQVFRNLFVTFGVVPLWDGTTLRLDLNGLVD